MESQHKNQSFMNLYTPVHPRLCRYVQTLVWQKEDAKDLISEITLQAFERFDSIKHKEQFVFFLFGVARKLFLKKLRRQKFNAKWNDDEMNAVEGYHHADDGIKKGELAGLLGQLPPLQQEAITLFEVAGFSYEEIAGIQQMSLSRVKSNIFKGRQSLKEIVARENERLVYINASNGETRLKMDGLL